MRATLRCPRLRQQQHHEGHPTGALPPPNHASDEIYGNRAGDEMLSIMAAGPMMRCNRASDEIYGNRAGDEIYGHRPIAAMLAMLAKLCCLRLAATAAPRRRHPTGARLEPNNAMADVYGNRASDEI